MVHNEGGFEKKKMAGAAGAIAKTGEMLLHTAQGGDVQAACLMDRKS